ncbi:MAG: hypothetical protein AAFN91_18315, partial [Pseudomonadota bacterium]
VIGVVLGTAIGVCSVSRTCGVMIFSFFQFRPLGLIGGGLRGLMSSADGYQLGTHISFFNMLLLFFGN